MTGLFAFQTLPHWRVSYLDSVVCGCEHVTATYAAQFYLLRGCNAHAPSGK